MDVETLILREIESLNKKFDKLNAEALQRLTELETQVAPLFDNGQPGRCTVMAARVVKLENERMENRGRVLSRKTYITGWVTALTLIVAMLGCVATVYDTLHKESLALKASVTQHENNDKDAASDFQRQIKTAESNAADFQRKWDEANLTATHQRQKIESKVDKIDDDVNTKPLSKPRWYQR